MSEPTVSTQSSVPEPHPRQVFRMFPYPHFVQEIDGEVAEIGLFVFFRIMFSIAWSSFRYPFSTTVIDYTTGKIIENT